MASREDSNVDNTQTAQNEQAENVTVIEDASDLENVIDIDALQEDEDAEETAPEEELTPLEQSQKDAAEYLALAQRTRADLENFRRRTLRERDELRKYGSESVLLGILEVLDNVESAQAHAQDDSPLAEGFRMLHKQLVAVLERSNVTEVGAEGALFDPTIHEALQTVPSDDVEKGHIAQVYQKGYKLHDRLLRAAKVAVAG